LDFLIWAINGEYASVSIMYLRYQGIDSGTVDVRGQLDCIG